MTSDFIRKTLIPNNEDMQSWSNLSSLAGDSSSDDDSDAEVKRYLEGLSEKDRALLLQKLEGKESTHHHSTHKHKHHHHKKRHSYSLF